MEDDGSRLAPGLAAIRPEAPDEIPVLDLTGYFNGLEGERQRLAEQLRHAMQNVGFYFIVGHGISPTLIDATFAAAARFHSLSLEQKLALKLNEHNIGYMPLKGSVVRHSQLNADNKPNLLEAFGVKPELSATHPDVLASKPFRGLNQWPHDLPGFRDSVLAYCRAVVQLGQSLLPLYAVALDLSADFFATTFSDPMFTFRLIHYPPQDAVEENEFGFAPHTDTGFMTLLPENKVGGLSIRLPNGRWIDAPAIEGSFLINGGDLLRRWTNDRFLATPHRVTNRSGRERYALPFIFDCNYGYVMHCLPTCHDASNPPRYEPITYAEYMTWIRNVNYGRTLRSGP
jgi:isopenicillin N synthase-like dioxygenase